MNEPPVGHLTVERSYTRLYKHNYTGWVVNLVGPYDGVNVGPPALLVVLTKITKYNYKCGNFYLFRLLFIICRT